MNDGTMDTLTVSQVTHGQIEKPYFNTMCTEPDESTSKKPLGNMESKNTLAQMVHTSTNKMAMQK